MVSRLCWSAGKSSRGISASGRYPQDDLRKLQDAARHVAFRSVRQDLGELLFDWAYNWICGEGGFFLKDDGVGRRRFPGMRLVEVLTSIFCFCANWKSCE